MSPRMRQIMFLGTLGLVALLWIVANRTEPNVPDYADQLHLRKIAGSVYEYHGLTGKWPTDAKDLLITSLAREVPLDISLIQDQLYVVIWSQDLKPDPKDNAERVLVYAKGGPLRRGWKWVCWGDFRMEYMSEEQLQAALQASGK